MPTSCFSALRRTRGLPPESSDVNLASNAATHAQSLKLVGELLSQVQDRSLEAVGPHRSTPWQRQDPYGCRSLGGDLVGPGLHFRQTVQTTLAAISSMAAGLVREARPDRQPRRRARSQVRCSPMPEPRARRLVGLAAATLSLTVRHRWLVPIATCIAASAVATIRR